MSNEKTTAQLCVFRVPRLTDYVFGLTLSEVLAVSVIPEPLPVPFSPSFVLGLSVWRDQLITVVDLAAAMLGKQVGEFSEYSKYRFVIGQTIWGKRPEVFAWPILEGTETYSISLQDVRLSHESALDNNLMYSTIHTTEREFILVNTTNFANIGNLTSQS
jgi:chemotaxis signal transduction protein